MEALTGLSEKIDRKKRSSLPCNPVFFTKQSFISNPIAIVTLIPEKLCMGNTLDFRLSLLGDASLLAPNNCEPRSHQDRHSDVGLKP